jgi:hypothetical protein
MIGGVSRATAIINLRTASFRIGRAIFLPLGCDVTFDRMFVVGIGSRYRKALVAGTTLAGAALLPSVAQAQNVWGGTGSTTTTTNYNLGTNWSTPPAGAPPVAGGQSAQFANTGSATVVVTAGPIAPDSWTFNANAQTVHHVRSARLRGTGNRRRQHLCAGLWGQERDGYP